MRLRVLNIIKDKLKPWDLVKTAIASGQMCKTCKEKERRNGSSYCQECSDKFKQDKIICQKK